MSGETCTIPKGIDGPGKLLISPTTAPVAAPVPTIGSTWSRGSCTAASVPLGGGAAVAAPTVPPTLSASAVSSAAAPRAVRDLVKGLIANHPLSSCRAAVPEPLRARVIASLRVTPPHPRAGFQPHDNLVNR
ncbi:hypothetical protein GCM10009591_10880 [Brachybacterium tyrofermentans]